MTRKKKTSRALICLTVFICLAVGILCTRSSGTVAAADSQRAIPDDVIVVPEDKDNAATTPIPTAAPEKKAASEATAAPTPAVEEKEKADLSPAWSEGEEGWVQHSGFWYYAKGGVLLTGWIKPGEAWYYLDETGQMKTGWLEVKEKWYYLEPTSGIMITGWLQTDGYWYYLNPDGDMATGWIQWNDQWYYLNDNGSMATGWITDKGKDYYLRDNGSWDESAVKDSSEGPMVALTFDDGPGPYTDRLLDTLEAYGAKATFFMIGTQIPQYPQALTRMEQLGCELANHTLDHQDLTSLDGEGLRREVDQTNQLIANVTGHGGTLLRPPYGAINDSVKAAVGMPMALWSIDTLDWQTLDADKTTKTVLNTVKEGDIILMHDIHETSVAAAERIIPKLAERGYRMVTVSELAAAKGITLETGKAYGAM